MAGKILVFLEQGPILKREAMEMLDSKLRAEIIRQGNAAFNDGDYKKARELFTKAGYKDGLIRLGDYYMYERRLPLLAYGYYKRAGAQAKIQDIHQRMLGALAEWIGRDRFKEGVLSGNGSPKVPENKWNPGADGMIAVPVSPELKQTALKILEANQKTR